MGSSHSLYLYMERYQIIRNVNDYFVEHLWDKVKYVAMEKMEVIIIANLFAKRYDYDYFWLIIYILYYINLLFVKVWVTPNLLGFICFTF